MTLILHDARQIMCNIYNFGFDKHPMFYYISDPFDGVCQVLI